MKCVQSWIREDDTFPVPEDCTRMVSIQLCMHTIHRYLPIGANELIEVHFVLWGGGYVWMPGVRCAIVTALKLADPSPY